MCREDELLASSYPRGNGNYMTIQTQNQQAEGLEFGCASPKSRHIFSHYPAPGTACWAGCFRKTLVGDHQLKLQS